MEIRPPVGFPPLVADLKVLDIAALIAASSSFHFNPESCTTVGICGFSRGVDEHIHDHCVGLAHGSHRLKSMGMEDWAWK